MNGPCPLCEGIPAAPRAVLRAERRWLLHCGRCDLLFAPKAEQVTPAQEIARYRLHENTIDNAGYVARFERLMGALPAAAGPPGRALDYGCGPGPVLVELLRRRGWDATGYDPLFAVDVDLSRPFDVVTCTEVVEHFRAPRSSWAHLAERVRPGGWLAVTTLLHPGPERVDGWWYSRDETHVAFYSRRTLEWIAAWRGWRVAWSDGREMVVMQCGE